MFYSFFFVIFVQVWTFYRRFVIFRRPSSLLLLPIVWFLVKLSRSAAVCSNLICSFVKKFNPRVSRINHITGRPLAQRTAYRPQLARVLRQGLRVYVHRALATIVARFLCLFSAFFGSNSERFRRAHRLSTFRHVPLGIYFVATSTCVALAIAVYHHQQYS